MKEELDLLIELFQWDDDLESRFSALRILCGARREECPTWDDFKAGRVR